MICIRCGRRLTRAAVVVPAKTSGPDQHPAGAVGPTCARNAGLLPAARSSLFGRLVARKVRRETGQMQLLP